MFIVAAKPCGLARHDADISSVCAPYQDDVSWHLASNAIGPNDC